MPELDLGSFERDGVLSEEDYGLVSTTLSKAMGLVRVPAIRKGLIFKPADFSKYEKDALLDFDKKNRPIVDPEMAFDFTTIPVTLCSEFNNTFFPDFVREYEHPDILNQMVIERGVEGYAVLATPRFRSLLIAGHQLETAARAAFAKTTLSKDLECTGLEIETTFMVPPNLTIEVADDLRVHVTFFLLFD